MTFGQTLKQQLTISGVKSSVLASRLGYDTSYISRWMNDIKMPSLKNNSHLFSQIANGILAESDHDARERLRQAYCPNGSDSELANAMEAALSYAFNRSQTASQPSPSENQNAVYFPEGMYKNGYDTYIHAITQYAQDQNTTEIPCVSSVPLRSHSNRDTIFWNTILSAPQILGKLHITMHQLIDCTDFSAHTDSYCAAICTFSHYRKGVRYEFYEYPAASDIHSVQFTAIADRLLCQNLVNPFTGKEESFICTDASALSAKWQLMHGQLQMCRKLLTYVPCSAGQFHHYLYDFVMDGRLRYLLNVMHPIYISDELAAEFKTHYCPDIHQQGSDFYLSYNSLCAKAQKEVVIFRSALLEYIYSGMILFWGRLIKVSREHRIHHLRQLLENMKQGNCRFTIINDLNPLLNYSDIELSLYLSRSCCFMTSSDGSDHAILQIQSPLAIEGFNQFFCHLEELDNAFTMSGTEAWEFIERGISLI